MAEYLTNRAEVSGATVKGVSYDIGPAVSGLIFNDVTLNSSTGTRNFTSSDTGAVQAVMDTAYTGETIYVVLQNRKAYKGIVAADSSTVALTESNYDAIGPEAVRLRLLGYI